MVRLEAEGDFRILHRLGPFLCILLPGESENADVDWKGRFMESREAVVAQFH